MLTHMRDMHMRELFLNDMCTRRWNPTDSQLYVSYGTNNAATSFTTVYTTPTPFAPSAGVISIVGTPDLAIGSTANGVVLLTRAGYITTAPAATTTTPAASTLTPTTSPQPSVTNTATAASTSPVSSTSAPTSSAPATTASQLSYDTPLPFDAALLSPASGPTMIDLGGDFTVTFLAFVELNKAGAEVASVFSPNPTFTSTSTPVAFPSGAIGARRTYTAMLTNGAKIQITLLKILEDYQILFAGETLSLEKNQQKQTLMVENWPWLSSDNRLEIRVSFGATLSVIRSAFTRPRKNVVSIRRRKRRILIK